MGADLSYVEASVTNLARYLKRRALIVGKSTVPVGTAEWIEQLVAKHTDPALRIEVAWSPEFLQEGFAVEDVLRPNRIVVGVKSDWANGMLYAAHKGVFDLAATEDREVPLVVTDFATAELVKVAANAFLATKIIRAFQARAQELGAGEALRLLHEVDLVNLRRRGRVIQLAAELLDRPSGPAGPDLAGTRIAVLGAAFKPNFDDVRDSPSLAIAASLAKAGADVRNYDPQGTENARAAQPSLTYAESMTDAVTGAELVCVLTEWAEFRNADPIALGTLAARRLVIDGRNCLDPRLWAAAGWTYRGMGRPRPA